MSQQLIEEDAPRAEGYAAYYGKIPLAGDFIARRIKPDTVSLWDDWLRSGLHALQSAGNAQEKGAQRAAAVWNFILPPSVCSDRLGLIGLIGDSCDRVGRRYPFTLFQSLTPRMGTPCRLERIVPFFIGHAPVMHALQRRQMALEQLESALDTASGWQAALADAHPASEDGGDIFSIIGTPATEDETTVAPPRGSLLPWIGLDLAVVMQGNASYWWTNQTMGGPLRALTHDGALNDALFATLFNAPMP